MDKIWIKWALKEGNLNVILHNYFVFYIQKSVFWWGVLVNGLDNSTNLPKNIVWKQRSLFKLGNFKVFLQYCLCRFIHFTFLDWKKGFWSFNGECLATFVARLFYSFLWFCYSVFLPNVINFQQFLLQPPGYQSYIQLNFSSQKM